METKQSLFGLLVGAYADIEIADKRNDFPVLSLSNHKIKQILNLMVSRDIDANQAAIEAAALAETYVLDEEGFST